MIKVIKIYEIDYRWSDSKEILHDLVAQITDDSENEYQSLDTKLRKFGLHDNDILFYSTGETEDKLVKDLKDNDIIVKNIKVYNYANG